MRLYLDACRFIYLVEGQPAFRDAVIRRVERLREQPGSLLFTSRLSRLECRTKPLRTGDSALLATYESVLSANRLELVDIGAAVLERATELRARHRFKTPDALHLATAIEVRAHAFLTGDADLLRCTDVRVELISSVSPAP